MTQPQPPDPTQPSALLPAVGAVAVILAYQQATQAIRQHLTDYLTALWWSLGSWREPQQAQFVAQAVPMVEAAMQQMASLTAGYHAAVEQVHTGRFVAPAPTGPVTIADVRNGADPEQVYGRPFHQVWRDLADLPREPGAIDRAIEDGLKRAVESAVTDVQLAKTHTSQQVMERARHVVGYRRVLEGAYSCGLCVVASTNQYHKKDLLPIHPGCDCSVAEIFGDEDPAAAVNEHLLGDVHAAIAERFGAEAAGARAVPGQGELRYRDVIVVHQHGELGPILGVRGQDFTGPTDLTGGDS